MKSTFDLGYFVTAVQVQSWLLDCRWIAIWTIHQEGLLSLVQELGACREFRCQSEHVEYVLVALVTEIAIEVQLKWHDTEDEVLVVEQILYGLILDEVEFELEEVAMAEHGLLSLQDDRVGLPAQLVVDL